MTAASDGNNAVTWNWIEHEKLTLRLNTVGFAARNPGSIRWKLQFQLLETISFLPMKLSVFPQFAKVAKTN